MPEMFDDPNINALILSFLEYEDIIRLRRVNQQLYSQIGEPILPDCESKPDFINLLSQDPVLDEYSNSDVVSRMWMCTVFGGSVLNSIKRARTGIGGQMQMNHFQRKSVNKEYKKNSIRNIIE